MASEGWPEGLDLTLVSSGDKIELELYPGPYFYLNVPRVNCNGREYSVNIVFEYQDDGGGIFEMYIDGDEIEPEGGFGDDFADFQAMWDVICFYRRQGAQVSLEFKMDSEDLDDDQITDILNQEFTYKITGAGASFLASSTIMPIEPDVHVITFRFAGFAAEPIVSCEPWLKGVIEQFESTRL